MSTGKDTYDAYVEEVYDIVRTETMDLDAVYGDFIIALVGLRGLGALIENRYLETCGVVNDRQLYTLCCEGES